MGGSHCKTIHKILEFQWDFYINGWVLQPDCSTIISLISEWFASVCFRCGSKLGTSAFCPLNEIFTKPSASVTVTIVTPYHYYVKATQSTLRVIAHLGRTLGAPWAHSESTPEALKEKERIQRSLRKHSEKKHSLHWRSAPTSLDVLSLFLWD